MADKKYCQGCRDDYYNHNSPGECWMFKTAKVVIRYKIGWWTQPTQSGAYSKVKTHSCHHAPGRYALHEKMSDCFPDRSKVEKSKAEAI